ncbi:MAG TPA: hypothetical protein VJN96_00915 [Vicinamibacterales bacterium]|nr:hypothetical protein [Vicinamibacterales bacterium]
MKRRTLLQSFVGAFVATPLARWRVRARMLDDLSDAHIATLKGIAEIVVPSAAGAEGRQRAVAQFTAWVANYKAGADRGHGYGNSQLSAASGPSPAARYPDQFAALDKAARDQGAASFAAAAIAVRRTIVESALNTPQPVTRLPNRPTGANLVADFMGMYFSSADAMDLCYQAEIGRDTCRGLENSEQAPKAMAR